MKEIIKDIFMGIVVGFAVMVFSVLLLLVFVKEYEQYLTKTYMLKNILSSAIVGIGFYVPRMVYKKDNLAGPIKAIIHMGIGYIIFFPMALYANWIPINAGTLAITLTIAFMIIVSLSIWFGFYLHYRNEAKAINQKIKQRGQ